MKMQSIKKIILGLILLIFLCVGLMYILALIPVNKNISMSIVIKSYEQVLILLHNVRK